QETDVTELSYRMTSCSPHRPAPARVLPGIFAFAFPGRERMPAPLAKPAPASAAAPGSLPILTRQHDHARGHGRADRADRRACLSHVRPSRAPVREALPTPWKS